MKLLDLSQHYWETVAKPDLSQCYPNLLPRLAAGLVGNGSECFGYDDEQSRDHDWGIDFFLWVKEEDRPLVPMLQAWKLDLLERKPPEFRRQRSAHGAAVGVMTVGDFYCSLLGMPSLPDDILAWRRAPEENFALATNGAVFWDGDGAFSTIRGGFLAYYPEDLRRKKIAARCMAIAQTGQYNFKRIANRGDWVTVQITLSKFIQEAMGLVYHLNRVYRPYYKWTFHKLKELPILGTDTSEALAQLVLISRTASLQEQQALIDWLCGQFVQTLQELKLSNSTDWFLASHGEAVQRTIQNEALRSLPPQYE